MLHRNISQSSSNIIASYGAVSLTTAGWSIRAREAWNDKHHEFFLESAAFYQSTIFQMTAFFGASKKYSSKIRAYESWIIESKDGELLGRIQLHLTNGDFDHGILFVDLEPNASKIAIGDAISQLITCLFLALSLDTQKIVPLNAIAVACIKEVCETEPTKVLSLSLGWLPEIRQPLLFHFDQNIWMSSPNAERALKSLEWLKKRMDRMASSKKFEEKEQKRHWFVNLLTFGRNRRRSRKMIHPLDRILRRR
jgi:hypothetical protein